MNHPAFPSLAGAFSAVLLLLAGTAAAGAFDAQTPPPPVDIELPADGAFSLLPPASRGDAGAQRPAAIIPVTSCADSGIGSLRKAIGDAVDGDTIDLTGLNCGVIALDSILVVPQDNLTIQGDADHAPGTPVNIIDAQGDRRVFNHFGTGILHFKDLWLRNGYVSSYFDGSGVVPARGGCVSSAGSIVLENSLVSDCVAEDNIAGSTDASWGGAIEAATAVIAGNSTLRDNRVSSIAASASGGAIFTPVSVGLVNVVLEQNEARSEHGAASGGGASAGYRLIVSGSTIRGNRALTESGNAGGGGLLVGSPPPGEGDMNYVLSSQLLDNHAEGPDGTTIGLGGALLSAKNGDKTLSVLDTVVSSNSAGLMGGGLLTEATLVMGLSTIAHNASAGIGGGLIADLALIQQSTIARNQAVRAGGAILGSGGNGANVKLIQSTVSGNLASGSNIGAGLFLGHHTEIWNSTITDNVELGMQPVGAGVTLADGKQALLKSSIVSGNQWQSLGNPNNVAPSDLGFAGNAGGSAQGDHNLIGEVIALPVTFTDGYEGIFDPQLGPLANNGGPTWTHVPKTISLAYNRGDGYTLEEDQRGPGYARVVAWQADIGSVERDDDRIFRDGFDFRVLPLD